MSPLTDAEHEQERKVVGTTSNFWIWSREFGWDLSHPPYPDSTPLGTRLFLNCEISKITIDPAKSAFLIIDMQNFTLSTALRGEIAPRIRLAEDAILKHGIPAARRCKIQIIWLNWGLAETELKDITPSMIRIFGWKARNGAPDYGLSARHGNAENSASFLQCGELQNSASPGAEMGEIRFTDEIQVDAGRALMRNTWNAALHDPLAEAFNEGRTAQRPDVLIHKNRNSGMPDKDSACTKYLRRAGIRTLLFAGVNTDQCVMATLQDAHSQGFDTVMLKDGCATDSPIYAQQSAEYNCCRNWGFLSTCKALAESSMSLDPH